VNRKVGERLCIGDQVVLTVLAVCGQRVHLKIDAPEGMTVWREDMYQEEKGTAEGSGPTLEICTWLGQTVPGEAIKPA
jgi:carbon storage regulator